MISVSTQEGQDAAQALLAAQFKSPTIEMRNTAPALDLEAASILTYRGRQYLVPPVSWRAGLQLQHHFVNLQRLIGQQETVEQLQELVVLMTALLPLFKVLVKPISWLERLQWRWTNPFNDATQQELGELLGFFFACRMRSSVRFQDRHAAPHLRLSTASRTLPSSPGDSRLGA